MSFDHRRAIGVVFAGALLAMTFAGEREAAACGGCFQPPTQTANDITDERMLLSVSTTQTTLYDQIRYSGNPTSFAWVLPIKGTVDVGLSADVLFDSIDALTDTQITAPYPDCPPPPAGYYNCLGLGGAAGADSGGSASFDAGDVTVTKEENVGPYETVQLHATDSSALETWLANNGFDIPAATQPVIDAYVAEGFDFLAMKLLPNQGIKAMRPVRVTSPGASLSLPLRMAAIGTGATVGITIWVVSDGRYEPQNFPSYRIADSELVWDFATSSSNYTTLRAQHETALANKGWEMECSLDLNEQLITQTIRSGGIVPGNKGASTSNAADDYAAVPGDPDAGTEAGAAGQTADDVRDADIATLLGGLGGATVRVTRMRGDISHAAMNVDLVLTASSDQSELSNVRTVTKQTHASCPSYPSCPADGGAGPGSGSGAGGGAGSGSSDEATGGGGGGGCATTASANEMSASSLTTLGALCAFVVVSVVRSRKRRRRA